MNFNNLFQSPSSSRNGIPNENQKKKKNDNANENERNKNGNNDNNDEMNNKSIISTAYVESIQVSISSLMEKLNTVGIAIDFDQLKQKQASILENSHEYFDLVCQLNAKAKAKTESKAPVVNFPKVPELSEFQRLMDSIAPPIFLGNASKSSSSGTDESGIFAAYAIGEAMKNDLSLNASEMNANIDNVNVNKAVQNN